MNQVIARKIDDHFKASLVKNAPKSQLIALPSKTLKKVFYLLEGIVEQYYLTSDGTKITVAIFRPPAFFPMSGHINKTTNNYYYGALTDVKFKEGSPEKTIHFLKENPDVLFDLLSRVYKGMDTLLKRTVLLACGDASSRLAFELLIDSYRFGVEIETGETLIKVKQIALAARTGLARETISRELQKMEERNIIKKTKRGLVLNMKKLEGVLDFRND